MKNGYYYKLIGSYEGVVWTGTEYTRFECECCARQMGIAVERHQGPITLKMEQAFHKKIMFKHDKFLHQLYIEKNKQS